MSNLLEPAPSSARLAAARMTAPPSLAEPAPYVSKTKRWALVAVVVLSFLGAAMVAAPLGIAIVFGVVMAFSVQQPYRLLKRRLGEGHASLAAAIIVFVSGLLFLVAGVLVLFALANELLKVVAHLNSQGDTSSLAGLIGERSAHAIEKTGVDTTRLYAWARGEVEAAASYVATAAAVILRTSSSAVLGLVVALMTMYYVLREGQELALRIERIAPLEPRHTRELILEAREVGRTAFIGTIATAIVQGVLAGVGYAALGVPQPVTWAVVTALASFLPVVGTLTVWMPIATYLLMDGHPLKALVMTVYGLVVVTSLADYVIRPRIVGGHGHGHPLLTLIALLGGIEVFGLGGLIIAPIIMSIFVAAFRLYERELATGTLPGTKALARLEGAPIPPGAAVAPPAVTTKTLPSL